eukprot:TRINITY_DN251_c0_g1_i4.p1 TRINITY_DN251_c0_g1~~TRINITY_DN251_c0_g1_i4.p1  ORF type:complete len:146 (-),score=16.35 TRINITY_DN251_c0_g1_i4:33-470(-)
MCIRDRLNSLQTNPLKRPHDQTRPIQYIQPTLVPLNFLPVINSSVQKSEIIADSGNKKQKISPNDETKPTRTVRKRGRKPIDRQNLICDHCETRVTPEWRRGPTGKHSLCNACGLKYAKILKRRPKVRAAPGDINFILNNPCTKK